MVGIEDLIEAAGQYHAGDFQGQGALLKNPGVTDGAGLSLVMRIAVRVCDQGLLDFLAYHHRSILEIMELWLGIGVLGQLVQRGEPHDRLYGALAGRF